MTGPRPKPDAQRQRRNAPKKPAPGHIVTADIIHPIVLPAPKSTWSDDTKELWQSVWSHPIRAAIDLTLHERPLRRLFDGYDEYEKLLAWCMSCPIVEGSMGQTRANPLYSRLSTVESKILALEDRTGLNPKAMADLGISFAGAKRSLNELAEESNADVDQEDPRSSFPQVIDIQST